MLKIGHKAVETTCNINNAFGPGTANEHTVQWWFGKFLKGDESLEDEHSGQPSEVDNDQLRAIIKGDALRTTWEVAEELSIYILQSLGIQTNWNSEKALYVGSS